MAIPPQLPNPYLTTGKLMLKAKNPQESERVADFLRKTYLVDKGGQLSTKIHGIGALISTHFSLNISFPNSVKTQKRALKELKNWAQKREMICQEKAQNRILIGNLLVGGAVLLFLAFLGFTYLYPLFPILVYSKAHIVKVLVIMIFTKVFIRHFFRRVYERVTGIEAYSKALKSRFHVHFIAQNYKTSRKIAVLGNFSQNSQKGALYNSLLLARAKRHIEMKQDLKKKLQAMRNESLF